MIKESWNLIGQEPFLAITWKLDFSQAFNFRRMLMNHNNFHFTQIPEKINDMIFLKSPKTMFSGHFRSFLPDGEFFQKIRLCHTQLYMDPYHHPKFQKELMSQSRENLWTDGRIDGQALFYRILRAEAGGPTTSRQQVTGGNTPNLILKRMLRYFLKIPPLNKILQF